MGARKRRLSAAGSRSRWWANMAALAFVFAVIVVFGTFAAVYLLKFVTWLQQTLSG